MTPRVSVIMSVRDAEPTLATALRSIRVQTLAEWELLVADDGSQDGSARIVAGAAAEDPRIRVIGTGGAAGLPQRLNELVGLATAPLLARMDADDVAYPERLRRQVAFLEAHPEVDLVGAAMTVFGANGKAIGRRAGPIAHAEICARPALGFRLFHPTWMGRRAWFAAHPYAVDADRGEDQDLLQRTYRSSTFANLPDVLLGYREEQLDLRRILAGRRTLARRVGGRLWRDGDRTAAAAAVLSHLARGAVDVVAVQTGLGHRLLPQRARPLGPDEAQRWAAVWAASNSR